MKKTEKSIVPSSRQSLTNSSTGLLNKNKIPKEVKEKQQTSKKTLKNKF